MGFSDLYTLDNGNYKTFIVSARYTSIGNNKSMISILNGSSEVKIKLRELYIVNVQNTAITGVIAEFSLKRITGHSSGTKLTEDAYDTQDVLNASVTIRTGATVSGESSSIIKNWDISSDEWGSGTTDVESSDHSLYLLNNLMPPQIFCKPFTLNLNEGLTIKQTRNSTQGSFDIVIVFTEEPK